MELDETNDRVKERERERERERETDRQRQTGRERERERERGGCAVQLFSVDASEKEIEMECLAEVGSFEAFSSTKPS